MKLYRNAIILLVVVAILGGVYFLFGRNKGSSTDNAGSTTTAPSANLTDYTSDKIQSVTIKDSEGTIVIEKSGSNWKVTTPANFNADATKLSDIAVSASTITTDKLVTDKAGDLSQYGLDNPSVVTIKPSSGAAVVLDIGSQTPTKDDYYVMAEGTSKIYTVSSYTVETLLSKLNDIRSKTIFTFKSTDLIDIGMERNGKSLFTAKKTGDSTWSMETPIQGDADFNAIGPMLDAISGTTVSAYIDDNPTDLGKYGLANPKYVLDFSTSSQKYRLLLGAEETPGSAIYAKLDGQNSVFSLDESAFTFLDKPLKEIASVFAYMVNINQVTKVEITIGGKTDTLALDIYKDASGKSEADKDKFTFDGKDASGKDKNGDQPARKFYQALIGITLDDIDASAVPSGTPDISLKYYLKSAPGTMTVDFIPKDADNYYIMRNGKYAGIIVSKTKDDMGIQGMKDSMKTLVDFINNGQK